MSGSTIDEVVRRVAAGMGEPIVHVPTLVRNVLRDTFSEAMVPESLVRPTPRATGRYIPILILRAAAEPSLAELATKLADWADKYLNEGETFLSDAEVEGTIASIRAAVKSGGK